MLTVGEILKREREKKNISLKDVEKRIRVREKYLKALEENNWSHFSSKIYISGIIKNYANFLGLESGNMLAFFRRDYEKTEEMKFKRRISSKYLTPQTRKIAAIAIGLVFVFFFSYFGYQLTLYFLPPKVEIISPTLTQFKDDQQLRIRAKTEKEATITIFGERIFQDKQGNFEYNFPLHKGKNELVIEVISASGKKQIIKKEYFREK